MQVQDVGKANRTIEQKDHQLANRAAAAGYIDMRHHVLLRQTRHKQLAERAEEIERRHGNMRGATRIDHAIADSPKPRLARLDKIAHLATDPATMLEPAGSDDHRGAGRGHDSMPR